MVLPPLCLLGMGLACLTLTSLKPPSRFSPPSNGRSFKPTAYSTARPSTLPMATSICRPPTSCKERATSILPDRTIWSSRKLIWRRSARSSNGKYRAAVRFSRMFTAPCRCAPYVAPFDRDQRQRLPIAIKSSCSNRSFHMDIFQMPAVALFTGMVLSFAVVMIFTTLNDARRG